MAYMGLIAFNGESAGSLESILRHYFRHEHIAIVPCIRRWVAVPEDQQTRLGAANDCLNLDFILGSEVPDQTGKFRIRVTDLTWERFNDFLPCGKDFTALQTLVKFVLRSRLTLTWNSACCPMKSGPGGWKSTTSAAWAGPYGPGKAATAS